VTAEWDNVQERIFVKFDCDNANLVIGRDGQTLEAIQYLVTLIVSRHTEHHAVVQADTANYWKNQEDKIISDLNYGIDSVRRSGQLYRLAAMNPAHRRFVHKHLADHPDVETTSEGEGNWRKVVLRPKKH
jgi:spoIIIJ-associated protein